MLLTANKNMRYCVCKKSKRDHQNSDTCGLCGDAIMSVKSELRERNYDYIFRNVEKKVKRICSMNKHLLDEPEIIEIIKTWTLDILELKMNE